MARNDRYTVKKVYIIICETCNEDITRPVTGRDIETRADADEAIAEHEHTWHADTPVRGGARASAQSREQAAKPRRVKWQVWDVDRAKNRALVVDEGTEDHCAEIAEQKNRLAEKHGMDALYMALPKGQTP